MTHRGAPPIWKLVCSPVSFSGWYLPFWSDQIPSCGEGNWKPPVGVPLRRDLDCSPDPGSEWYFLLGTEGLPNQTFLQTSDFGSARGGGISETSVHPRYLHHPPGEVGHLKAHSSSFLFIPNLTGSWVDFRPSEVHQRKNLTGLPASPFSERTTYKGGTVLLGRLVGKTWWEEAQKTLHKGPLKRSELPVICLYTYIKNIAHQQGHNNISLILI